MSQHHKRFSRNRGVKKIVENNERSVSQQSDDEFLISLQKKQNAIGLEDFFERTKNY